jgi:hypothetical protein
LAVRTSLLFNSRLKPFHHQVYGAVKERKTTQTTEQGFLNISPPPAGHPLPENPAIPIQEEFRCDSSLSWRGTTSHETEHAPDSISLTARTIEDALNLLVGKVLLNELPMNFSGSSNHVQSSRIIVGNNEFRLDGQLSSRSIGKSALP